MPPSPQTKEAKMPTKTKPTHTPTPCRNPIHGTPCDMLCPGCLADCWEHNAAFIVRACNHFEKMLSAMKQVKASLDKKRYSDRKEGELEGYFALCDAIKEAEND